MGRINHCVNCGQSFDVKGRHRSEAICPTCNMFKAEGAWVQFEERALMRELTLGRIHEVQRPMVKKWIKPRDIL